MKAACLMTLALTSQALAQGTISYFWEVNDSGSNSGTIAPGEVANLKLWATWMPDDYGFAGSIYDIVGLDNWSSGAITLYENQLDWYTDHGDLQPNNDILAIESFVLPPVFGDPWLTPPTFLYEIEWATNDYTPRTVRVGDANHLHNTLYTDDFGSNVNYDADPGEAIVHIIPAPATSALFAFALASRRRA